MKCPVCDEPVHEVYFADDVRRWRCMKCERIFSEAEYQVGNGELVRIHVWRRERDMSKMLAGDG